MAGHETLFYELASTALKLIKDAMDGDTRAFKRISPMLPKEMKTTLARKHAEARARKKLRGRR